METPLISLPVAAVMMQRLKEVVDQSHFEERFYPLLIKEAGRQLEPMGVVLLLMLAVDTYSNRLPNAVKLQLAVRFEDFIRALVVDPAKAKTTIECYHLIINQP